MPSTSKKQHKFMEAVAHNPAFAKKAGVPQSVGKDFSNADKGKTFKRGGEMATKMDPKMMAMMAAKKRGAGRGAMPPARPAMPPAGGMSGDMSMMKKGGKVKKMAEGGMPMVMKDGQKVPAFAADGKGKMASGGMAKKMNMGGMAYAKGGGIESKGKTKGKMIVMKSGGGTKKYC
jgi:hypothetical protein